MPGAGWSDRRGGSTISEIHHLRRGYEDIVDKFTSLGADIRYV